MATTKVFGNETQGINSINAPDNSIIIDPTGDVNIASIIVTGGTIDGAVIGGVTPAAGSFTTLDTTGKLTVVGTNNVENFHVTGYINGSVLGTPNILAIKNGTTLAWHDLGVNIKRSGSKDLELTGETGIIFKSSGAALEKVRIDASGNLNIGLATAATSSAGVITLGNGTTPTSNILGISLYAIGGALYCRGGAGTLTLLGAA